MHTSTPLYILKREAKRLAKRESLSWLEALNCVAKEQGYSSWSLLQAKAKETPGPNAPDELYAHLAPGELVLVGSRPGFGKTMLALRCLLQSIRDGGAGFFFTLDYARSQATQKLLSLGTKAAEREQLTIDCSDDISASYIIKVTQEICQPGTLLVVDYLQLLDQKRTHPPLQRQVEALREHASQTGCTILFLSQIDRSFEESGRSCPDWEDVRRPNPLALTLFDKGLFLHKDVMVYRAREA